jgi:hypothetical protein
MHVMVNPAVVTSGRLHKRFGKQAPKSLYALSLDLRRGLMKGLRRGDQIDLARLAPPRGSDR